MKQNKKLNLSEAANQVMGVLDATGKSDADASGRGSALPYPVDTFTSAVTNASMAGINMPVTMRTTPGTHATAAYMDVAGVGKPDVAKHTNTEEGNEDADETEDYDDSDEEETKKKKEVQMENFRNALISLLGEENMILCRFLMLIPVENVPYDATIIAFDSFSAILLTSSRSSTSTSP